MIIDIAIIVKTVAIHTCSEIILRLLVTQPTSFSDVNISTRSQYKKNWGSGHKAVHQSLKSICPQIWCENLSVGFTVAFGIHCIRICAVRQGIGHMYLHIWPETLTCGRYRCGRHTCGTVSGLQISGIHSFWASQFL